MFFWKLSWFPLKLAFLFLDMGLKMENGHGIILFLFDKINIFVWDCWVLFYVYLHVDAVVLAGLTCKCDLDSIGS